MHFDEARRKAASALSEILDANEEIARAVLIDDLFGKIRVIVWAKNGPPERFDAGIAERMSEAAGPFWVPEIWHGTSEPGADQLVYEYAWEEGLPLGDRLRVTDRVRNRLGWFQPITSPLWSVTGTEPGPPIVVFYSFKGGVGRTTALAAFAIQRARLGETVAVVDFDLDAPGVGSLLAADNRGTMTAQWGVADYLLERPLGAVDFRDYYHACRRTVVSGGGQILVVPAGQMDPDRGYLEKLARLPLDWSQTEASNPLRLLFEQIRAEL
ncbi:MAG: KGGVGR-motif variant AAA ATPase [Polyangiaceae bacterium]